MPAGWAGALPGAAPPSGAGPTAVFQVAAGYEDSNDADRLRQDPLLATVCDRTPDDAGGLSSQPTLSRLEDSVDGPTLRRLLRHHESGDVASLPVDQEGVILDIDSTANAADGAQLLSFFNAHDDPYIYHLLLVFDGGERRADHGPPAAGQRRGAAGILRRRIRKIRRRCPKAQIVVRGDAGFCVPKLLRVLERLDATLGDVDDLLGMSKDPRLLRLLEVADLVHQNTRRIQLPRANPHAASFRKLLASLNLSPAPI